MSLRLGHLVTRNWETQNPVIRDSEKPLQGQKQTFFHRQGALRWRAASVG